MQRFGQQELGARLDLGALIRIQTIDDRQQGVQPTARFAVLPLGDLGARAVVPALAGNPDVRSLPIRASPGPLPKKESRRCTP